MHYSNARRVRARAKLGLWNRFSGLKESAAVLPYEKSLVGRALVDEPEER